MASQNPGHNKERVWFKPTDSDEDRIFYEIRDVRIKRHADLAIILSEHPAAGRETELQDYVFVHREPADQQGRFVRDWYAKRDIVDNILSVVNEGNRYSSRLIYTKGTDPPTEDDRIDILGDSIGSGTIVGSGTWVSPPDDLFQIETTPGKVTEDAVYITFSGVSWPENNKPYKVVKFLEGAAPGNNDYVQLEIPYDATEPKTGSWAFQGYQACYILDGYTDTDDAPGVLQDKFHVRSFTYRLAEQTVNASWDNSLGIPVYTERRIVPREWSHTSGVTTASASETESISYGIVSKNLAERVKQWRGNDTPTENNIDWKTKTRIQVPAICVGISFPYAWAEATRGEQLSLDDDYGVNQHTIGPWTVGVESRIVRYVNDRETLETQVDGLGEPFSFKPKSYPMNIGSWMAYSGSNMFARARVRTATLGPFLLKDAGATDSISFTVPQAGYIGIPAPSGLYGGQSIAISGNTVTLTDEEPVPWGTEVLWETRIEKARWGYWMLDLIYVTLPANPAASITSQPVITNP